MPKQDDAYHQAVRTLFCDVDPIGLVQLGAPRDEYDPEIDDLLKPGTPVTPDQVTDAFDRWFSMRISDVDATRLAAGISRLRAEHGPDARSPEVEDG